MIEMDFNLTGNAHANENGFGPDPSAILNGETGIGSLKKVIKFVFRDWSGISNYNKLSYEFLRNIIKQRRQYAVYCGTNNK